MLALDKTFGPFGDLAVWGDHEAPSLFYYFPNTPRLARGEAGPELSFIKFRRDLSEAVAEGQNLGGGLLSFTVELRASEDDLTLARKELSKLGIESPTLSPLPIRAGKAVLVLAGGGPDTPAGGLTLFESILGETTPSLFGSERALFSLKMPNHESAELVAGMLRGQGPIPMGVRYELEHLGLRPAIAARIVAHYDRIYHEMKTQFGVGVAYNNIGVEAEVGVAVQRLREIGALEVEIFEFTDEGDLRARTEAVLREFQENLTRTFFRSSLPPPPGAADKVLDAVLTAARQLGAATLGDALQRSGAVDSIASMLGLPPAAVRDMLRQNSDRSTDGQGSGPPFQLKVAFSFKETDASELKTQVLDYRIAAAEKRILAPQALLDGLLQPGEPLPTFEEVDLASAFFQRLTVRARPAEGNEAIGVDKLVLHLEHPAERPEGEPAAASKSVIFEKESDPPVVFSAWLTGGQSPRYRYRMEAFFRHDAAYRGRDVAMEGPWVASEARELVATPAAFVDFVAVEIRTTGIDFRDVAELNVLVTYGEGDDAISATATLNEANKTATLRFRLSRTGGRSARRKITWFLTSGLRVDGAEEPFDGDVVLCPGPFQGKRDLRLVPLLPPGFLDCAVIVRHAEEGYQKEEAVTFAAGENKAKVVSLPTLSSHAGPVEVTTFVTRGDGSFYQGPPQQVDAPVVVVTDRESPARRVSVELVAGSKLSELGLAAVKVELLDTTDGVLDALLFTESRRTPVTWVVAEPPDAEFSYRYRVVRFLADGTAVAEEPRSAASTTLLIPARG